ncbi:hypothetical protein G4B88_027567 [Cannabis sativa]|uniref:RNase H type-1 domain-containing protein n=1 Tax=Cannabis sativa TaxID=3483 RepID=A0A7J6G6P0_CANSA|nr:hypothetical protein G4B88_027567 [Cannabis sativa]
MEPQLSSPVLTTNHPSHSYNPFPQLSLVHPFSQSSTPPPIMTTSVITHIDKGKGIAMPDPCPPRPTIHNFTRNISLTINEPCLISTFAASTGFRRPFTRQTAQIGGLHTIPTDNTALFVDATLDQSSSVTGLCFVFKQGSHQVLASASIRKPGAPTPIFAEGQALLEGLSWDLSLQLQPDLIFTDYLNLVSKVNGEWNDNFALSSLVSKIRQSFSNFPAASLHHLPRQFNAEAHHLAKEALRQRERIVKGNTRCFFFVAAVCIVLSLQLFLKKKIIFEN